DDRCGELRTERQPTRDRLYTRFRSRWSELESTESQASLAQPPCRDIAAVLFSAARFLTVRSRVRMRRSRRPERFARRVAHWSLLVTTRLTLIRISMIGGLWLLVVSGAWAQTPAPLG